MSSRPTPEVQQIDLTKLNLQQLQQLKIEFESVQYNQFQSSRNPLYRKCISYDIFVPVDTFKIFANDSVVVSVLFQELNVFQESLQTLKIAKTKFDGSK